MVKQQVLTGQNKIKQVERDSHAKSEKIRQLQEKNMATVISTPSKSAKKVTAPRRQKVTIDSTIPFSKMKAPPLPAPNDLVLIDVLKMAEQRSAQLEQEVKALKQAQKQSDDRVEHVRRQKALVEGENERLRRQLEGGRPREAVTLEQVRVEQFVIFEIFAISSRMLRILMEHIEKVCSLGSKLFLVSICYVRILNIIEVTAKNGSK